MPSSRPNHLSWLCQQILEIKPKSILDIGVGFGSKGMLFREYTDIWNGNYHNWQTRIDGIEIFEKYITPLQKLIYSNIYIGNAGEILTKLGVYDLIYLGDIIEHLEKNEGRRLLIQTFNRAKITIIATPIMVSRQGPVHGNKYETHKSQWDGKDFIGAQIHRFDNTLIAKYGL